jgi:hypothetical protein
VALAADPGLAEREWGNLMPQLSDDQLASMREIVLDSFPHTGLIARRKQVTDAYGHVVESWVPDAAPTPCRAESQVRATRLQHPAEAQQNLTDWNVFLPYDQTMNPGDRITVSVLPGEDTLLLECLDAHKGLLDSVDQPVACQRVT